MEDLKKVAQKVNLDLQQWGVNSAFLIVYHPLEYAKTLAQIGYEPYPPVESWFFGNTYLGLPNMFQYVRYIKTVDGFIGCYKGLLPRLCGSTVSTIVYNTLSKAAPVSQSGPHDKGEPHEVHLGKVSTLKSSSWVRADVKSDSEIPVSTFLKKTAWDIVCVTGSTIAAHPFHVIAVRTMAQFVGRESKYTGIKDSICEIYSSEGIKGFFSGLVPRLVGDVIYISISATVVYLVCKNFKKTTAVEQISGMTGNMVASSFSYPFQVVANNMIVNNSGLAIGSFPYTKKYSNWLDAYTTLKAEKQIKRGSSIIARAYTGPTILIDGKIRPYGFHFGPAHPPGLKYKPTNFPTNYPRILDKAT